MVLALTAVSSQLEAVASVSKANWLITSARLKELEANVESDHIWIITQSLEEEIDENNFGPVIAANFARGMTYTYFVPDNPQMKLRIGKLKLIHNNNERLKFRVLKNELFALVSAQDVAIFGPLDPTSGRMTGYMNLPIHQHGSDYFILLGPQYAEQIVAVLMGQPFDPA